MKFQSITSYDYVVSATTDYCYSGDFASTLDWINQSNLNTKVSIRKININPVDKWIYSTEEGLIKHETGGFYNIEGLRIRSNLGQYKQWDQPIINQNEIGYLGFLVKKINDILHFLVQAKVEPGNINNVQISPTLQATRSNCLALHKGKKPKYLEYFENAKRENVLVDNLHSELGEKFLRKRNRNIIVSLDEDVELFENFRWITLRQIKQLSNIGNILNIDSRSVLATIRYYPDTMLEQNAFLNDIHQIKNINSIYKHSFIKNGNDLNDIDTIVNRITNKKVNTYFSINKIKLSEMDRWSITDEMIKHDEDRYFKVIGINASISNRENLEWQQPMIEGYENGICCCIAKIINGKIHLLTHLKAEFANRDVIELGPTLILNSIDDPDRTDFESILLDYIFTAKKENIVFDSLQSYEGGRFYQIQNRHCLVFIEDNALIENFSIDYLWISINQLTKLNRFDNMLNIELRSIISMLPLV